MGESAEVVRRLYRAMNERDLETVNLLTSDDAEWVPDERVGHGAVRGRERVLEFFDDRAEAFEDLRTCGR